MSNYYNINLNESNEIKKMILSGIKL